jgi:pilus assembly protein CpaE
MANMPKRPEIAINEFATAIGVEPMQVIEFDSEHFGQASNNGQMVEEFSAKAKAASQFRDIALALSNRREMKAEKQTKASALAPLLQKLKFKR